MVLPRASATASSRYSARVLLEIASVIAIARSRKPRVQADRAAGDRVSAQKPRSSNSDDRTRSLARTPHLI